MNLASTLSHLQTAKRGLRFARNLPRLASFARVNPATLVAEWAETQPHTTALLFEENRWNWRQLNAEVNRWSNWLISRNVRSGEVMAILMENRPDYIFLAMALNRIGAIAALINTNLSGEALRHSLKTSNAHHLFVDQVHRQTVDEALRNDTPLPHETVYILEEESADFTSVGTPILDELQATVPKLHQNDYAPRNADVFCYIFTSGTTGLPKGALISHRAMIARAGIFGAEAGAPANDTFVAWTPLFHMGANDFTFATILRGGKVIVVDGYQPEELADIVETEVIHYFTVIPGMILDFIDV